MMLFERKKLKEIGAYVEKDSGPKCVKFMHSKLLHLMKYYLQEDKGVLPFVFGKHVHKKLTPEELKYIPKSLKLELKERHEAAVNQEGVYREAWEQLTMDRAKRSEAVLRHKL